MNTATGTGKRKSELFLSATSVDDNGTFSCFAQNKAGKAKAEFTLHVVVPMPPKPPQVRHMNFIIFLSSSMNFDFYTITKILNQQNSVAQIPTFM